LAFLHDFLPVFVLSRRFCLTLAQAYLTSQQVISSVSFLRGTSVYNHIAAHLFTDQPS
jgi:hypothetical protein